MRIKKFMSVLLVVALMFSFCSFFVSAAEIVDSSNYSVTTQLFGTNTNAAYVELAKSTYNPSSVTSFEYGFGSVYTRNSDYYLKYSFSRSSGYVQKDFDLRLEFTGNNFVCFSSGGLVAYNFLPNNCSFEVQVFDIKSSSYKTVDSNVSFLNIDGGRFDILIEIPAQDFEYSSVVLKLFFDKSCFTASAVSGSVLSYINSAGKLNITTEKEDNSGWFQKIIDAIKSIPTNLKAFFDNLGSKISNIQTTIESFFVTLIQGLNDFFTMLKNYLLYFQDPVTTNSDGVLVDGSGNPVYTNPFDSAMNSVKNTVDGWLSDIDDFIADIDESRLNVKTYLETGSGVINDVLGASPILSAAVIFAAAFLVIRKVVGR